ncbi:glycoside hydrolase family 28 protein [candidate division KSB1 bacterium]|nr:glycoside hydrolase family 28 protein [candidate division KSB1 bacterium]
MNRTRRINRHSARTFILLCCVAAAVFCMCGTESSGWDQVPDLLGRIVPPVFPKRDFDIVPFGAVGDGITDCTDAFARAVDACHKAGGGRVVVPSGSYLTGAIHLKSNVNLHLQENATIKFSIDPQDFLPAVLTRFEGVECMNYSPFIYAYEQKNIAITGAGTLDGQADSSVWWAWKRRSEKEDIAGMPLQHSDRMRLFEMAEKGVPVDQRRFGKGHFIRPNFIQPYRCENVLIEGVTIIRSPMWNINPVLCSNVIVRHMRVVSHGPNNDGCNPESCRDVWIKDCYFDTGDDCIAIKSGRNADGRRLDVPSENIVIQNCTMKDGHGGVVIGSEISGGCRNVFAEDCVMDSPNLERALRIKTNSVRGGVVENIYMRNIQVGEVSDAVIRVFFYYEEGDAGCFTPLVRNLHISHVTSEKSVYALLLIGYERSPISNIVLSHCRFDNVANSNMIEYVENVRLQNVFMNQEALHNLNSTRRRSGEF